jgi:hypothetical protein
MSTIFVLLAGLLVSCGTDTVAGKTTTTSNGGGVVALGPDGKPLAGCVAFAARSWDPLAGKPGIVDTLQGDSAGNIPLPLSNYAFLEIEDSARSLGSWTKRVVVPEGSRRTIVLDSLRLLQGRWADHASIIQGRLFLDSSFRSTPLQDSDGSFTFGTVPTGDYEMVLEVDAQAMRPMGSVRLGSNDVRYVGSGNIVVTGDTTGSPLWIDDFESGTVWPLLHQSIPGVSPWYIWTSMATLTLPTSSQSDSLLRAIGPDSTRPGRSFHSRFVTHDPYAWVALGLTGMEIDLSARSQLCFSYRSDTLLKIQFQRDSMGTVRPAISSTVPSSLQWRDVCVATSGFVPNSDNPDTLKTWSAFGKRVLVIEFQVPAGGTYMDLDDIRMR